MPKLATDSKTSDISFNDFKNEILNDYMPFGKNA